MYTVVLADDEEIIRNGLEKLINSFDIDLKVIGKAKNGVEALKLIKEYSPNIIIMDINMPLMDGLKTIEKINEIDPLAKTIIISGYDKFEYAKKALELGVFNYLLKPINIEELKSILEDAIKSYSERLWEINQLNKENNKNINTNIDVLNFIRENFSNNKMSLQFVSDSLFLTPPYLSKLVKEKTGITFTDYLNKLRINKSIKLLLSDNNYSIKSIASMVGYSTQHYFSRAFKNYTGLSPVNYRNEHQKS